MVLKERQEEKNFVTESVLNLELARAGATQTMKLESRFVETRDFRAVEIWSKQQLGAIPMETTYLFDDDSVIVQSASGERRVDRPEGPWLTPFAATREVQKHLRRALAAGASETDFEIRTLDPNLGLQPLITSWELVERAIVLDIAGEPRTASRWRQSPSYAPTLQSTVDISAEGDILRSVTPVMGLEMTVILSTREAVMRPPADSAPAPELLVPSFLYPDRPIPNPRKTRRAVYRLRLDGEMPELPSSPVQRVKPMEGGARVSIDLDDPSKSGELKDRELYLRSTDFLRHDDPAVRALIHGVDLAAATSEAQRAEALRRFVAGHLTAKNLDSILATASEAAETRSGDCTEHAVLLAALLRAEGIPARVATGVIYAERFAGKKDLFAYHMWTQAWLEGRWVDLDATLDEMPFDAAHILMGVSALEDGASALVDMAESGPLIGRVSIEIESLGGEEQKPAD